MTDETNEGITHQYRIVVTGHSTIPMSGVLRFAPPGQPPRATRPPLVPGEPPPPPPIEPLPAWEAMHDGLLAAGYEAVLERVDVDVTAVAS